jgi:hypothetical protein
VEAFSINKYFKNGKRKFKMMRWVEFSYKNLISIDKEQASRFK